MYAYDIQSGGVISWLWTDIQIIIKTLFLSLHPLLSPLAAVQSQSAMHPSWYAGLCLSSQWVRLRSPAAEQGLDPVRGPGHHQAVEEVGHVHGEI